MKTQSEWIKIEKRFWDVSLSGLCSREWGWFFAYVPQYYFGQIFTSNFLVIFKLCTSHLLLEGDLWTTCINLVFTPLGIIVEVFSFLGYMCPKIMTRCNLIWKLVCVSYISFCFQNLNLTYSVAYPESVGEAHSHGFHLTWLSAFFIS